MTTLHAGGKFGGEGYKSPAVSTASVLGGDASQVLARGSPPRWRCVYAGVAIGKGKACGKKKLGSSNLHGTVTSYRQTRLFLRQE